MRFFIYEAIFAMFKVYAADHTDLKWMYTLVVNASNKGHFQFQNNKEGRDGLKATLYHIVFNQKRPNEDLRAQAMIFENELGKVGFAVMSEMQKGYGNEIFIFVVDKKLRGNGYGQSMLDEIIKRWHFTSNIYASCFPASKVMANMLRKSGFVCEGKNSRGIEFYKLEKIQLDNCLMN